MINRILAMVMALSLILGSTAMVAARDAHGLVAQNDDATPAADDDVTDDDSDDSGATGGDPVIGDTVLFVNDDGDDAANITVEEVIVPFEDFGEFFTPEEDATYLAVALTIENVDADDDAFEFSSFNVGIQTADGFYYSATFVSLDEDEQNTYPELENDDIAVGDTASGYLFFAIPEDKEPARLFFSPSGRLLLLADIRDA
ncbi:MAG: DUF4352 domain-containing protein [Thermomicrobiales bacterium]